MSDGEMDYETAPASPNNSNEQPAQASQPAETTRKRKGYEVMLSEKEVARVAKKLAEQKAAAEAVAAAASLTPEQAAAAQAKEDKKAKNRAGVKVFADKRKAKLEAVCLLTKRT